MTEEQKRFAMSGRYFTIGQFISLNSRFLPTHDTDEDFFDISPDDLALRIGFTWSNGLQNKPRNGC